MNNIPNKLISEKSPYLIQHIYNPVYWYPWGEEAFTLAKEQNKPIFLSIGYSTCHWCHVMAHESFENEIIADYLNKNFISIKLDREEYPEIDNIYMHICQMVNGNGGWPLTVFMDFSQRPFFVNTYFPPEDRHGRIGFLTLLKRINEYWINEPDKINASIEALTNSINFNNTKSENIAFDSNVIDNLYTDLINSYDRINGGFGNAPKFPSPQNYLFLLDYSLYYGSYDALKIVIHSLYKMRLGGIFDHVGFGFHRYSTDKTWLVPHFEKMLYDQAMLLLAYSKTYKVSQDNFFKEASYDIIQYLIFELISKENGFYSAQDADSEGEEGKYYVWSYAELYKHLNNADFEEFCSYFNIKEEGNYLDERTRELTGNNILHISEYDYPSYSKFILTLQYLNKQRKKRVHPLTDTKILTDWNGLAIWALAESGINLNDLAPIEIAEKTFKFIINNLIDKDNKLFHRYIDGEKGLEATADDYAFLIRGLLSLFKATTNIEYLEYALAFNEVLLNEYWDKDNYGFYYSPKNGTKLITRSKQLFDNAIPSANSVSALNLLNFYSITGDQKFIQYFEKLLLAFDNETVKFTRSLGMLIDVFLQYEEGITEIIIAENNKPVKAKEFLHFIYRKVAIPYNIVYLNDFNFEKYKKIAPHLEAYYNKNNDAYIYICKNGQCDLPINDIEKLKDFEF